MSRRGSRPRPVSNGMYVVSVIPIGRRAGPSRLSFFSKDKPELGSLVHAPIRGTTTPSVVVEVSDVREEKLSLKDKSFALKKIVIRSKRRLFPNETMSAINDIARYHALPLGAVLSYFAPAPIMASLERVPAVAATPTRSAVAGEEVVLQAEREERVRMYRNLVRECFARGESVILSASTIAEVERLACELNRGIEEQVVVLTSALTKKAVVAAWARAVGSTSPLLIILTPSFLAVPCPTASLYILERESSRSFVARERPHLDARVAATCFARARRARLLRADFPLRIETHARVNTGAIEELMRLQVSAQSRVQVRIIDARRKKELDRPPDGKRYKFSAFTEIATRQIRATLEQSERAFLYTSRRGLAPLTVCNDCGAPIVDPGSGTPMTLHKTSDGNVFISSRSGLIMPSNISCANCGSWNLVSLGIGVERVVDEALELFPDASLFTLTADTAPTHAKARRVAADFFNTTRALLVGTDRALPYLAHVPHTVVVSMDSLLSLSAWRAHTYALHTLFYLRDHTDGTLHIQTRLPDHPLMHAAATGNPSEFIRHELAERREFGYPPFSTFIGLTWGGTERAVAKTADALKTALALRWDIVGPLPARHAGNSRYVAHAVIRLKPEEWPNDELVALLAERLPEVTVTIDPDEIV